MGNKKDAREMALEACCAVLNWMDPGARGMVPHGQRRLHRLLVEAVKRAQEEDDPQGRSVSKVSEDQRVRRGAHERPPSV